VLYCFESCVVGAVAAVLMLLLASQIASVSQCIHTDITTAVAAKIGDHIQNMLL
jgi:hypothetical protein